MEQELYFVEVGVLLDPNDKEFEWYNIKGFFEGELGFYDEDRCAYKTYKEAKEYADKYIDEGVDKTYAIIHSYSVDVEDEDIDNLDIDNPEMDCVLYFAYKRDKQFFVDIIKEVNKL
jgi:hypothetical protein